MYIVHVQWGCLTFRQNIYDRFSEIQNFRVAITMLSLSCIDLGNFVYLAWIKSGNSTKLGELKVYPILLPKRWKLNENSCPL